MFKAYPKIHRLGKEETEGILEHPVIVQEKIDGANISIWLEDGEVKCGSRTRELPTDESFRGFTEAVKANPEIEIYLQAFPTQRLYGEWLVKHTIDYPATSYGKIYLFDIYEETEERWFDQVVVANVADTLALEYPTVFAKESKYTYEEINKFVGTSGILNATIGEGVVIKSIGFVNKFGNHAYAKIVSEKFKESNAITFGGNNKHSDSYEEMYIVNKYCTLARAQKNIQKFESQHDRKIQIEDTREISGRCLHDMVTEECWEIFNMGRKLDNKQLKNLANRKFIQIFHDILNDSISVADNG